MKKNTHVRNLWSLLALLFVGSALTGCALLDLLPTLPPDQAPTGVTASLGQFEDQVQVTWVAVDRATTYRVFRTDTEHGTYQLLGTSSSLVYADAAGTENQGRLYWYKVQACNMVGCGPESAAVVGYAGYPPAPTNVQASDGTYPNKIVITWNPVPGATHYQVFRDRNPDVGFPIVPGADNVTTTPFDDTTATAGIRYWYRVKACNAQGCSLLSEADSGCRGTCIPSGSVDTEG